MSREHGAARRLDGPDADSPETGSVVCDRRDGRVGVVMDRLGHRIALRPEGGGREWFVLPEDVTPITAADTLREEVQRVNERQGWYV